MSQVTEQSVRFQTALASIKLIQASAVLDLTEDDFDFLTSNKVWIATDRSRARRCVEACVYGTLDFVGYPRFPVNINIIARRTGKDVNSHTVLDGIITTIMATIQRINIIGSREGSRNRRRLKANQTGKKFRVGIKSNISTNRNNLISGVDRCIH